MESQKSRPIWRDAPNQTSFRAYGASDAKVVVYEDELRLVVRSAKTFVALFAVVFIPAFVLTAWWFIPDQPNRLFFSIGGAIVGAFTFALIYALLWHHEKLGDYFVINRSANLVQLPRHQVQFPADQVFAFQLIRGRSKTSSEVESDLNLLVAQANELLRYHILGSPDRRIVRQVVDFSGIGLEEIDLGSGGFRDAVCSE